MDRKTFIGTAAPLIAAIGLPVKYIQAAVAGNEEEMIYKKPAYLKPGDLIGITSPAGGTTELEMKPAIDLMQEWGFAIRIGASIGKKDFTRGGTDEERLADLQNMLDDPRIKAIMCARGGYGSIRIVDRINWTKFKLRPKWLIGFSDITVLHSHIHANCGVASIHSKMTNSFPDDWSRAEPVQVASINSIRDALVGKRMQYPVSSGLLNKEGVAEGVLTGGNLKTLETLAGSASDIQTAGKILFVEDTGEYLYSIDRMFWNLKRTGKLKNLKGLIVGGFNAKPDDPGEEFGRTLQEIVLEKIKAYHYPVCFDFPVGHQKANFALKCGVRHRLKVTGQEVTLSEIV
jgi:muramoyltetrapeptide carboxypeptidase